MVRRNTRGRGKTNKFSDSIRRIVAPDSSFMKMLQNASPFKGSPLFDPLAKKNRTLKQRKFADKKGSRM